MPKIETMREFLESREESRWSPADTERVLAHIASIEAVAIALVERQIAMAEDIPGNCPLCGHLMRRPHER